MQKESRAPTRPLLGLAALGLGDLLLQPVLDGAGAGWCWMVLVRAGAGAACSKYPVSVLGSTPLGSATHLSSLTASSSLQKDVPQTSWAPAEGPAPPTDSDAPLSKQPAGEDLAKRPLPTEEAALPEEAGAADSAGDRHSPKASTSSPTNGDQVQPSSVLQPGTSA